MTTRTPLLQVDPDLGHLLDEARRVRAEHELDVEMHALEKGPWKIDEHEPARPGHVGLLLVAGVIAREVIVADTVSTELLGPGDVMRMWSLHAGPQLLRLRVRWTCLTESRVAILDSHFGRRLTYWPEINAALIDRLNERAQRLATAQAISQLTRVDRRLLALFWHLAERWGRITADGVSVPLTLSHRILGQLVGARRQTVSVAIGALAKADLLVRREDDTWLVKGEPTGVPTEEAQRVVPVRRNLMARETSSEPRPAREALVAKPHAPTLAMRRHAELMEACERLQRESREHLTHLQALADESRRLTRVAVRARRRRELARDA